MATETATVDRPTGRALDALIAERVFASVVGAAPIGDGLTRTREFEAPTMAVVDERIKEAYAAHVANGQRLWPARYTGPEYSTDIAAAWQVVEKMRTDGWRFDLYDSFAGWRATFGRPGGIDRGENMWVLRASDRHETAPEAICRAALAALEAPDA